jgi:hypothetical protein
MITAPGTAVAFEISDVREFGGYAEKSNLCAGLQQKGLTMTIGPSALFYTAATIRVLPPDPDPDDAATDYARDTAARILEECAIVAPCSISPVSIDQFEHDIFLRWQLNRKGLVLTCPGRPDAAPSLYRERIENERAFSPEVLTHAAARDLALSMNWMLFSD